MLAILLVATVAKTVGCNAVPHEKNTKFGTRPANHGRWETRADGTGIVNHQDGFFTVNPRGGQIPPSCTAISSTETHQGPHRPNTTPAQPLNTQQPARHAGTPAVITSAHTQYTCTAHSTLMARHTHARAVARGTALTRAPCRRGTTPGHAPRKLHSLPLSPNPGDGSLMRGLPAERALGA